MGDPLTWRTLLGNIIQDPHERQRIANALGVSPITLLRWVNNTSIPRPRNLHQLLAVLPQHRQVLLELISEEFEGFATTVANEVAEDTSQEIPPGFYARVLHTYTTIASSLRYSSLCNLILQQALEQLDPHRVGLVLIVVQCMPPASGHKVRSLRESVGRGTPPWTSNLEQHPILLGAESLAGYAVTTGRMHVIQNLRADLNLLPGYRGVGEESAVSAPIVLAGNIAGCLLVSCTQPDYFLPFRLKLIEHYSELIVLAFRPEDFYEQQRIELRILPPQEVQQAYVSKFRQRLLETMMQAAKSRHPMSIIEAERVVWQQLEEELLQLPPSSE